MKTLLTLAGSISTLIGLWLVSVLVFVAPSHSVGSVPLWSVVTLGLLLFGIVTILYARKTGTHWARMTLVVLAPIVLLFGVFLLVLNELAFRNSGSWEGYFVLMATVLIVHSVLLLTHLFQTRNKTLQAK